MKTRGWSVIYYEEQLEGFRDWKLLVDELGTPLAVPKEIELGQIPRSSIMRPG